MIALFGKRYVKSNEIIFIKQFTDLTRLNKIAT
ncbi:hypothetical protein NP493_1127g02000 [Ridgeia piscesae]|uniref:Uncharacterized protein n=1 Tax=Ridgeia piscesae TaxID=27915 RepID=A0AAD9KGN9_RIDPI|nr:hypothetical protein NP493_1127g02000 [Ridgeia piscesae]